MRGPQGYEWLIILAIVLVLFGGKKLPDLARSVGRSMRIFRSEVKDGQEGSGSDTATPSAPPSSDDSGPRA